MRHQSALPPRWAKATRDTDRSILTGALAGYAVFAMLQVDFLFGELMFFALLAYAHAVFAARRAPRAPQALRARWHWIGAPAVAVLWWCTFDHVNVRNWSAACAITEFWEPVELDERGLPHLRDFEALQIDSFARTEARQELVQQ